MLSKAISAFYRAKETSINGGKVVVWGVGKNSGKLLDDLTSLDTPPFCFVDNDAQKQGQLFHNLLVNSPDFLETADKNIFVIVGAEADKSYYSIRSQLERMGFNEGEDFADFGINCDRRYYSDGGNYMDYPVETYDLRMKHLTKALSIYGGHNLPHIDNETIVIPGFDLKITTYCTLHCRNCMHNNPYVRERKHFDPDLIVADLDKLLSVAYTSHLCILGGEPFLHPQLPRIVEGIANLRNIDHIGAFTTISNATVAPSDEVLESYKKLPAHFFAFNDYVHKKNVFDSICAACDKHGLKYEDHRKNLPVWNDLGDYRVKRDYSDEVLRHKRVLCKCVAQLFDGKFFSCSRCATSAGSGLATYSEDDYVDIRNFKGSAWELHDVVYNYLYRKPYLAFCQYCDGQTPATAEVSPAEQLGAYK